LEEKVQDEEKNDEEISPSSASPGNVVEIMAREKG